jgi:hypothetical protein
MMRDDLDRLYRERDEQREKLFAALLVHRETPSAIRAAAALDRIAFELVIAAAW